MSQAFRRATPATTAANSVNGDLSKEVELLSPPQDSIADLAWSPKDNYLAAAAWDGKVRIYDVSFGSGSGKAMIEFGGPALSCDFSSVSLFLPLTVCAEVEYHESGTMVVGASTDRTAKVMDIGQAGTPTQKVAEHEASIKSVKFINIPNANAPMIVTGSWDKTVKYWDLRQPGAVATLQCKNKVYSLDTKGELLVLATADRYIQIVDLKEPSKFFSTHVNKLDHQLRVVSCFVDALGYGVGCAGGRCSFEFVNPKDEDRSFSFRCHRSKPENNVVDVFSVNAISFHPIQGTFSTAGSDGTFHFWDKDARLRLKGYSSAGAPITATAFNHDGSIFAYGVSYDWSKGYQFNTSNQPNKIMLHLTIPEEVQAKAPGYKR